MRIGIDFRMLSCGRITVNRGMGRFTQQQLREVLRLDAAHDYVLLLPPGHDPALLLPEIAAAANVARVELPPQLAAPRGGDTPQDVLRHAAQLSGTLADLELDLYHATTPFLDNDPSFWRCDSCALVATHYDLIPLIYPHRYFGPESQDRREGYMRSARALRDAERLIAISEFVRGEAILRLGIARERIEVAHPIADPGFRVLRSEETSSRLAELCRRCPLPDGFVLCVTHLPNPSKNFHNLLRAYSLLPPAWRRRHPLVAVDDLDLAGRRTLDAWTRELGIHDDVVAPGFVDEAELVALYNAAYLFIHPSRYEGFGLPALEAMRCGAPVIAGDAAALPEVVGDAGLLVDPEDPASIVRAIERLDGDPGLRRELGAAGLARAEGFSGRRLGEATLRAYERAAGEASEWRSRPTSRPRLAVWSPLPPQPSGISDYTAELLAGLRTWADAEIFVDDAFLPDQELLDSWPAFHYTAFERRHRWRPFDLAVYQLGASMFHLYMLDAIQRWPGLLVLHDLTLSYVRAALFAAGMPAEEVRRELLEGDGLEALVEYEALARLEGAARTRATAEFQGRRLLLRPLIAASLAQIVHLPRAAGELEDRYPRARVHAFPMGVADPWRFAPAAGAPVPGAPGAGAARRRHGLEPDAFVVGVFGIADPIKRLASILRAVARLSARVPSAVLIVVGRFLSEEYRLGLERLAGELGIGERVRFLGQVARGDFNQLLLACDAVVNLRYPFLKQMSATLLRAVAAGKPVAVTDVHDWDHLPPSFCYRVPADETEDANLAEWLVGLALDPELAAAASRAAREHYLRHGTLQQMADRYHAVIEELTGGARADGPAVAPSAPEAPAAPGGLEARPGLRHNKVCEIEDFRDPELAALIRDVFPHVAALGGPSFPAGAEDRKHWEIAMSVRALRRHGALRPDATVLGVGAGTELTSFYLTREVARVVAIDRYLDPGVWSAEASTLMLTRPQAVCPYPFEAAKLTVQHMDGRVLDYADGSFAGVFSSGSIEHFGELPDVAAAAFEIGRVLEPGGVATLSTEFLISGPPGAWGWPGVLLFNPERLRRYVVEASGLEPVDELDAAISTATLRTQRQLTTAIREIEEGERKLPHLVLDGDGQLFGSVHLALRKTARYPLTDNSWARPSEALRAQTSQAAQAVADRLRAAVAPAPPAAPAAPAAAAARAASTGAEPPPPAGSRVDEAFRRWDAVRARSGLTAAAGGPLPLRGLRFLSRAGRRVRDLGVAWDRERELLQALIDELARQGAALARVDALEAETARLRERLAERDALLPETRDLAARHETLQARFGGLAVRQEQAERELRGHGLGLLALAAELDGASGGPGRGWELDAGRLAALLGRLEREVPALERAVAIEVSMSGSEHAEELRQAAAARFGARLSSHGPAYRYPNDAWLHLDPAPPGEGRELLLLEIAAGRLARGGALLLVTAAGAAAAASHPLLRPAGERDLGDDLLGGPARVRVWERV
ncbi:MAG TPA: glycosyltransferase [Thermoanaerobaculia bacterium]|jgi:glycosyltransferase involved in cell wall biosynthesis/SAM-dependent methyltransferase|nr:glycosyltransferase [Thermoanaerobaculia bacterium]